MLDVEHLYTRVLQEAWSCSWFQRRQNASGLSRCDSKKDVTDAVHWNYTEHLCEKRVQRPRSDQSANEKERDSIRLERNVFFSQDGPETVEVQCFQTRCQSLGSLVLVAVAFLVDLNSTRSLRD